MSGVVSFFVPDDTVLVADGGLATELEARGNDLSDSLWSARLLMDAPEQILDAHLAFFRAGAAIATSASYQASFGGFARRGLDRGRAAGLMVTGKPVIVYPNSGEEWDARRRAWAGQSRYYPVQPRQWISAGASIVGGCCRVRPADIAQITRTVRITLPGNP